jgi:squalene-hopene/tetraprenyl-beta-curcumene cyclase
VSYWSRTVIVPLLVLMALRPTARNPRDVQVPELFRTPPNQVRDWIRGPYRSGWGRFFKAVDTILRIAQPWFPRRGRDSAIRKAVAFVTERLNDDDGLGGIYPAIANSVMMYDVLGYAPDHPAAATAWRAVCKLLVAAPDRAYRLPPPDPHAPSPAAQQPDLADRRPGRSPAAEESDFAYCQPCLSPVWDTSLAGHAMAEAGADTAAACAWLGKRQVLDVVGDWAVRRQGLRPGGWAFQYANPHYPDVDDTAVVGMLLHRNGNPAFTDAIDRAREWIIGMQSSDGGWGAFEPENTHFYLNHIPFADHGALLDPPTADVTARCVSFLAQLGMPAEDAVMTRALGFLRREQASEGSWFGRWGTNYIYGTWSVLCALNAAGVAQDDPMVVRAVAWLVAVQRDDGGWGEDEESYGTAPHGRYTESTPSQTAWAVLGLLAAGAAGHPAVERGVAFLAQTQRADGEWSELPYTAVGFPRVFYLRYHGYRLYFPLLALARYRNLRQGNDRRVSYGF